MLEAYRSGLYSIWGHTCSKNMETLMGSYGDNKIQNRGKGYHKGKREQWKQDWE